MYFKTLKTSETGEKLSLVFAEVDICSKAQDKFLEKYGFGSGRHRTFVFRGGFSSLINPKNELDPKIWKKSKGEFYPKASTKEGKLILAEIKEMPTVSAEQLNSAVGHVTDFFENIGTAGRLHPTYYGFQVGDDWRYTPPSDCTEITKTEYDNLFK